MCGAGTLAGLLALGAGCGLERADSRVFEGPDLRIVKLTVASTNVYVVERDGKRLMIDAGSPGDAVVLERLMREEGIDPAGIDYLVLTHGYVDHAGTAAYFRARYGIEAIGNRADREMVRDGGEAEVCPTSLLARAWGALLAGGEYTSFELDRSLDGPLDLAELGMEGTLLPGSGGEDPLVAIFGDHVFVGDLIRGGILHPEEPATPFFLCDLPQNRARIRQLLEREELVHWHPGHFGPLEADAVREYLRDVEPDA